MVAAPVEVTWPPLNTTTPMLNTPVADVLPWPVIWMLPVSDVTRELVSTTSTP